MPWSGAHEDSHNNYHKGSKHEAHLSHELIAGAAAYEAAKEYEKHLAKEGRPTDHAKAKAIAAGFAGAFIDRQVETHGLDFLDKEKAKHHAKKHVEQGVDRHGGY